MITCFYNSSILPTYTHTLAHSPTHLRETIKVIQLLLVTKFIVHLCFPLNIYYYYVIGMTISMPITDIPSLEMLHLKQPAVEDNLGISFYVVHLGLLMQ